MECPVHAAARREPGAIAIVTATRRWSWGEVEAEVQRAAGALLARGVKAGDRLAVVSRNRPELIFWWFAAARVGAVWMPLNVRLTATERAPLQAQAQHLIEEQELAAAGAPFEGAQISKSAVVAALFTSGTTGTPKRVELTRGNFDASALGSGERLGSGADQRWLLCMPLFHVGALALAWRVATYAASLHLEPQFDAERVAALLAGGEITHASLVPTQLERLPPLRGSSALRAVLIGGGPMTPATLERARAQGLPVLQTYGLTEACSQVTTEVPSEADGQTAGRPLAGVQVRLSAAGEVEVAGPTIAPALGPWLNTGDLGALDARGRLTIFSRRTDLIVSGGENIYPAELEALIAAHPAVEEVAVVPGADAKWGQVPIAAVVWKGEPAVEALEALCREKLAGFKQPREWHTLKALPRNAMGKLQRQAIVQNLSRREGHERQTVPSVLPVD